jgi:hypothetical protein
MSFETDQGICYDEDTKLFYSKNFNNTQLNKKVEKTRGISIVDG